ncbi:UNVERIFIED_CONTAM: hypothetical protein Sangu_2069100 [Sesamum angustifolium]|uniref:Protein kinase domain-containing protein n=1 Tax=Sesamum angustifolium TaxID=2727405 RepID=A0AAW2LIZ2_9LAMI
MADQIYAVSPVAPFDYELYEGDPDQLRTVDATPAQPNSYIDPASLKLKYRIGHGLFGPVWVATHHQSASDYDEYHEVAVKMLHPIKDDHLHEFLHKFEKLWVNLKSRQLQGVCWLHGISLVSGQICIALKSYEGSIGDRMGQLKGGKLPLADVVRYGIELARGIQQLHQIGFLVLNLKPTNFLLDENDRVVLGDFGIPYLLLGIAWRDSHLAFRPGTPNYMAPEQWQPGIHGRDTSCRCNHQEKPQVPSGLPPAVEDVLKGCFEYDFRNRPLMPDILQAFESSRKAVYNEGSWSGPGSNLYVDKLPRGGFSKWFLSKNPLQVGDTVRSRKALNTCKPLSLAVTEGVVVGIEKDSDRDGYVLVQIPNRHNQLRVNILALERVTSGFASGDWVRLIKENDKHSCLGILHSIQRDGRVAVGILGLETLWRGHSSEVKLVDPFSGGTWASGKVSQILPNGCLVVRFPGSFVLRDESTCFLANPEEVECVSFDTSPGIVEKYELVEDFHWAVRPLAIAFSVFTAAKLGIFVGRNVGARINKWKRTQKQNEVQNQDGQSGGNAAWLPPTVANILFKEGAPVSNSR